MCKPLFFVTLLPYLLPGHASAMDPPNIVLYLADDMGLGDTSAFQDFTGNSDEVQLDTPNLDRLASAGMRFTDAHAPSSRCTTTRYALLTGRYSWRNRMKYWVLFGAQGDPMIEADRPTIASMLRDHGYRTAMFGKWHVGLRYRRSDASPAAGWNDADLRRPLHTTPLDHGFDVARFTARSHGTSGPHAEQKNATKRNVPKQTIGPGHIHGRNVVGSTGNGKQLVTDGDDAYVLSRLGSRHSNNAMRFLNDHVTDPMSKARPFFLYYAANANHSPYTPDTAIGGVPVKNESKTKSGKPMDSRHDFIHENDVAIGRILDWLESTDDPRNVGKKLVENTVVIFTSDNGAEKDSDIATGPFRDNKGSCFEGGHRVPFIVAWPAAIKPGSTNSSPIGLQDLYATFAEIIGAKLPDLRSSSRGAEDSTSVLRAFRGDEIKARPPLFFNDHKNVRGADNAVAAMRCDDPVVAGEIRHGSWKIFYDARLLRNSETHPFALYDLKSDQREMVNRIDEPDLSTLITHLNETAIIHRTCGGHRLAALAPKERIIFDWRSHAGDLGELAARFDGIPTKSRTIERGGLTMKIDGVTNEGTRAGATFSTNAQGLGISSGKTLQVDDGEAIEVTFDRDVLVESAAIVAGNGACGGFYRVGHHAPLAIYCVDADNDAKDQQGLLSDIGVLKKGQCLRLDSSPHFGVEPAGNWRLGQLTVRVFDGTK